MFDTNEDNVHVLLTSVVDRVVELRFSFTNLRWLWCSLDTALWCVLGVVVTVGISTTILKTY